MPVEINYQFLKKLETIAEDINWSIDYTTGKSVVLDVVKRDYLRLLSDWEETCDWADKSYISTMPYWDKISEIRKNLRYLNEFIASNSSSGQININGNVTGSTVIIGNNNDVQNKK